MKYITITGCVHYFGVQVFRVNQTLTLKKDLDNEYDGDAIAVYLESGMKVGYVANSIYTVARGTCSAGRIYDSVDMSCEVKVCFIIEDCAIAQVLPTQEA